MAKNFKQLIFGALHEKHAVQRGIWVPTQKSFSCVQLIKHYAMKTYGGVNA
jgi:hypothetical protein